MLVLQNAVCVDGECLRDGVNIEQASHRAFESSISVLKPGHLIFRDKLFPLSLVLIQADAEHDEWQSLEFL